MLTDELLQAVCDTLECDASEDDPVARAMILAWTRATLAQWSGGRLTPEHATRAHPSPAASSRDRLAPPESDPPPERRRRLEPQQRVLAGVRADQLVEDLASRRAPIRA